MIHESQIKKVYGSDVNVIRKGDKGWTSDAALESEVAATNPHLKQVGYEKPWTRRVQPDYREFIEILDLHRPELGWEIGDRATVSDWTDHLTFEYKGDGRWRFCYRERNAAL